MSAQRIAAKTLLQTLALICVAGCSQSPGEILPAAEMREKYQLSADSRPTLHLDPRKVPEELRDLVPLAEKWGIEDDLIREDFQSKATQAEKEALAKAVAGRNARITEWLNAQPRNATMSDEAAAFMYMQLGLDEMELWVD
jgi:hypothetical protein